MARNLRRAPVIENNLLTPMLAQIQATPAALRAAFWEMERAARTVLTTPEIFHIRRVILTGSGDSLFAGRATELAFATLGGIECQALPAMEASRYRAGLGDRATARSTLVIALSNSGESARTVEAARRQARCGALVLAVTKMPTSRLGTSPVRLFELPVPDLPAAPGYAPFLFAMLALQLLAIRIGEVRGRITMAAAQALRQDLHDRLDELAALQIALDQPVRALAYRYGDLPAFEFLASGPAAAVAQYGTAKILEAVGTYALAQDLEEWVHLNYFVGRPQETATVLICPSDGAAESRALELIPFLVKLDRPTIVLGSGVLARTARKANFEVIDLASDIPEFLSPLLFAAPMALLAAYMSEVRQSAYGRGGQGPWEDCAGGGMVRNGLIWQD